MESREDIKNKKYNFRLLFKNNTEMSGTTNAKNLDEIHKIIFENECTCIDNARKMVYYNSDEILFFEASEIIEGEE